MELPTFHTPWVFQKAVENMWVFTTKQNHKWNYLCLIFSAQKHRGKCCSSLPQFFTFHQDLKSPAALSVTSFVKWSCCFAPSTLLFYSINLLLFIRHCSLLIHNLHSEACSNQHPDFHKESGVTSATVTHQTRTETTALMRAFQLSLSKQRPTANVHRRALCILEIQHGLLW